MLTSSGTTVYTIATIHKLDMPRKYKTYIPNKTADCPITTMALFTAGI